MAHWLLRFFSTVWYVLSFGLIMPLALVLTSWSLDGLWSDWWGIELQRSWWLDSAGVLFFLSGVIFVLLASWTLYREGKGYPWSFGSGAAFNPQKLVTSGPYSVVRHPMASSYVLMLIGLGCFIPSLTMLVWMVPLITGLLYEYFEYTEEKRLLEWFGEEYEEYHNSTPSLLPHHLIWRVVSRKSKAAA